MSDDDASALRVRRASCSCGAVTIDARGEPVRVSMCHCLLCQKRTGSTFGVQARFADAQIVARSGEVSTYARKGDSGGTISFSFCPSCGAIVSFVVDRLAGFVVVPVGAFADPAFPSPEVSVYEARRHPWGAMPSLAVEHID